MWLLLALGGILLNQGIILIIVLLVVVLIFSSYAGLIKQGIGNRPVDQPLSKWISEDETIFFETDAVGAGYGTLSIQGKVMEIYFATGAGRSIDIYYATEEGDWQLIERWQGDFKRADRFTAVVMDKTTYYKKGEKITFYRVNSSD